MNQELPIAVIFFINISTTVIITIFPFEILFDEKMWLRYAFAM